MTGRLAPWEARLAAEEFQKNEAPLKNSRGVAAGPSRILCSCLDAEVLCDRTGWWLGNLAAGEE